MTKLLFFLILILNASRLLGNDCAQNHSLSQAPKVDSDSTKIVAYNELISTADSLFKISNWELAKTYYRHAHFLFQGEGYPKTRIVELDAILSQKFQIEKQYAKLIDQAVACYDQGDYACARENFQNASEVKPNQMYPKDMIEIIDLIVNP